MHTLVLVVRKDVCLCVVLEPRASRNKRRGTYTVVVWQLREVTILVSASMLAGSLQQQ